MYGPFNWIKSAIVKTPATSKLYGSVEFLYVFLQYSMCVSGVDVATKGKIFNLLFLKRLHSIHIDKSVFFPSLGRTAAPQFLRQA
jgi:hypothetical protein